jgi:hypothetical protein
MSEKEQLLEGIMNLDGGTVHSDSHNINLARSALSLLSTSEIAKSKLGRCHNGCKFDQSETNEVTESLLRGRAHVLSRDDKHTLARV